MLHSGLVTKSFYLDETAIVIDAVTEVNRASANVAIVPVRYADCAFLPSKRGVDLQAQQIIDRL